MLEFLGVIALIALSLFLYDLFTGDEVSFRIIVNGKDVVKYTKSEGKDKKDTK